MAGQMKRWEGGPLALPTLPSGLGPLPWPAAVPPVGWLICDGSAVSRVDYDQLFAVIGETFGAGDGVNTFNLPDMRMRFLSGAAPGIADEIGSSENIAVENRLARMQHRHTHDITSETVANNTATAADGGVSRVTDVGATDAAALSDGGNRHPRLAVNFIIKT